MKQAGLLLGELERLTNGQTIPINSGIHSLQITP